MASDQSFITDGSLDWSGGVDSLKVTTIQSARNPNGLARNELAWLVNATVRDGGISPRNGYKLLGTIHDSSGLFQGAAMYQPDNDNPYLLISISGHLLQVLPDNVAGKVDLTAAFPGTEMPPDINYYFFDQAELFEIIQCGDLVTLPLFWDGATLRRSVGLVGPVVPPVTPPVDYTVVLAQAWIIPTVGNSVVVTLTAPYPGSNGDVVNWGPNVQGTFLITNVTGNTITQQTQFTALAGASVQPFTYILETVPPPVTPPAPFTPEIPAGGPMDYFMGRLWYAQQRQYAAGDIVKGPSGTAAYNFRDSVLKVTENPLSINGDGFTVPDNAGNLRALAHSTQINASLGQGNLFPFSREAIYAQYVPITRANWIAANSNNGPLQTVVQLSSGAVNDRSIVAVNGDLYFQTLQPGIASLVLATRYFDQPGNIELSAAEDRILNFVNRALLPFATGCFFDNRLMESSLPVQLPQGVVHTAVIPLDFLPISVFGSNFQPVWEGHQEGLQILQMLTGDFGGLQRCFLVTASPGVAATATTPAVAAGTIQLYEQVQDQQFDINSTGESRITFQFETPAYTWGDEFQLKKLVSAEFWVDRIFGEVLFKVEYRPDGETCWQMWHEWVQCSARNTCEDVINPICYPEQPYGEGYRQNMALPLPPQTCATQSGRPSNVGFQFQLRVTIRGFCRVRGIQLFAEPVKRSLYGQMVCLFKGFVSALSRLIG